MELSALRALQDAMPFANLLGVELTAASPTEVRATMAWAEKRCTSGGVLHGGALMGLADSLGGVCAFLNLPQDAAGTTPLQSKTNLLPGPSPGPVDGGGPPLHVGRAGIVVGTPPFYSPGKAGGRGPPTPA